MAFFDQLSIAGVRNWTERAGFLRRSSFPFAILGTCPGWNQNQKYTRHLASIKFLHQTSELTNELKIFSSLEDNCGINIILQNNRNILKTEGHYINIFAVDLRRKYFQILISCTFAYKRVLLLLSTGEMVKIQRIHQVTSILAY